MATTTTMSLRLQEDADERPFVSRVINKLAHYEGGIVPNVEQESPLAEHADSVLPAVESPQVLDTGAAAAVKKKKKKKKAAPKKASSRGGVQTIVRTLRTPTLVSLERDSYQSGGSGGGRGRACSLLLVSWPLCNHCSRGTNRHTVYRRARLYRVC